MQPPSPYPITHWTPASTHWRVAMAAALLAVLAGCAFTDSRSVVLSPGHLACEADADCTEVAIACSSCGSAVATLHAPLIAAERQRMCRHYRGPVVDCPPSRGVVCRARQCILESSAGAAVE